MILDQLKIISKDLDLDLVKVCQVVPSSQQYFEFLILLQILLKITPRFYTQVYSYTFFTQVLQWQLKIHHGANFNIGWKLNPKMVNRGPPGKYLSAISKWLEIMSSPLMNFNFQTFQRQGQENLEIYYHKFKKFTVEDNWSASILIKE